MNTNCNARIGCRFVLAGLIGFLAGCSDFGEPVNPPDPEPDRALPQLMELVPIRTFSGDTLRILGTGFGAEAKGRSLVFGAEEIVAPVISWSETEVLVEVPTGIDSGPVRVRDDDRNSNLLPFTVIPEISFTRDLKPLLQRQGCESCHFGPTGNNGFSVLSPLEILEGGQRGPGALTRRAEESLIVRIVRGLDGLPRMPFGGNALPESEIRTIEDWIYQGARDN